VQANPALHGHFRGTRPARPAPGSNCLAVTPLGLRSDLLDQGAAVHRLGPANLRRDGCSGRRARVPPRARPVHFLLQYWEEESVQMFLWLLEPRSCLPARALAASRQSRVVAQCPSMLLRYIFGCTFVIDGGLYILAHIRGLFSRLPQPCATSSGSREVTLFSVSWADAQRVHVTPHGQNF
jgi:hypothetical protein